MTTPFARPPLCRLCEVLLPLNDRREAARVEKLPKRRTGEALWNQMTILDARMVPRMKPKIQPTLIGFSECHMVWLLIVGRHVNKTARMPHQQINPITVHIH